MLVGRQNACHNSVGVTTPFLKQCPLEWLDQSLELLGGLITAAVNAQIGCLFDLALLQIGSTLSSVQSSAGDRPSLVRLSILGSLAASASFAL